MTEALRKEFELWKDTNNKVLDEMFSGKLSQTPKEEVEQYFKTLSEIWKALPRRYVYAHSTLQKSIGAYFKLLGWNYGFEVPFAHFYFSHRFDIVAQKGANTIIVEVKPVIDIKDIGQILAYIFNTQKALKGARVLLGTDIANFGVIVSGGAITEIIVDNAKRHGLGVILASKEWAWLIPAEFLLI